MLALVVLLGAAGADGREVVVLDSDLRLSELSWEQEGQQYSARVLRQPAPDSTGLEQVIAEVTTEKDGKRMKTRLALKRLAFSHFTQLINTWDPAIALHDDVIDGRFHSNTEIGIAFAGGIKPQFLGKVTTSAARMTYSRTSTANATWWRRPPTPAGSTRP